MDVNIQGLYALEDRILGKGSFGTVYLGLDLSKDRYVSLKKIPSEIKADPQKLQALSNEILISAGVDNENLVKILDLTDIGEKEDKYIVYEFCNGGDLRRYLRYFKRFDEKVVQYLMIQVLNGVNELHNKKIIHHDIKPENVLVELHPFEIKDKGNINEKKQFEKEVDTILQLTDKKRLNQYNYNNDNNNEKNKEFVLNTLLKSRIKVSDFGLSKFKEDNNEKMLSGSPLYMDPNLFEPNVDIKTIENEKVDVWAIGIFAYELFLGKRPFNSPQQSLKELIQVLKKGFYEINLKECGKVSKQFLSFLNMCLQRQQKIRPNVGELMFSEFITRDTSKFDYITLDNFQMIKFPRPEYVNLNGKTIIMNIDDHRSINANFDY